MDESSYPTDWRAQALSFLRFVEEVAEQAMRSHMLAENDRVSLNAFVGTASTPGELRHAFSELLEHFVAPVHKGALVPASYGYEMLYNLMAGCFFAGSCATVSESAKSFTLKMDAVSRGAKGGQRSAAGRWNRYAGWTTEGLSIAQKLMKENPAISQDRIAQEICWKLDDRGPGHRRVKDRVAKWQAEGALPKRARK